MIGALGLGVYALYKNTIGTDSGRTEGSLGGSEDQFDDKAGFTALGIDPNTIPEQLSIIPEDVVNAVIPSDDTSYKEPTSPDKIDNISKSTPETSSVVPPQNNLQSDPTGTGFFGSGITAGQAALGVAGLLPSAFTTLGKRAASGTSINPKKVIGEAIEETPFIGKKLTDIFNKPITTVGTDVAESSVKTGIKTVAKKGSKVLVGSIPIIGTVAGAEFDVAVDQRPRWLAYPTNILGDVVGGALGLVTSPAVVTGVGTAVPVAVSVAGQVGTETAVYGVYDIITGKSSKDYTMTESFDSMSNVLKETGQISSLPDYVQTDFNINLSGVNQYVDKDDFLIDSLRFQKDSSGSYIDLVTQQSVNKATALSTSRSIKQTSTETINVTTSPTTKISSSKNYSSGSISSAKATYTPIGGSNGIDTKTGKQTEAARIMSAWRAGEVSTITKKSSSKSSKSKSSKSSSSSGKKISKVKNWSNLSKDIQTKLRKQGYN